MDPQQRPIVITSDSQIFALAQSVGGNPHNNVAFTANIVTVQNNIYYSNLLNPVTLNYNEAKILYFAFIYDDAAEAMPFNLVLFGYFSTTGVSYGQTFHLWP